MLPEGSLRDLIARELKIHTDDEFRILAFLGRDLPGALAATPVDPGEVPEHVLARHGGIKGIGLGTPRKTLSSLAGVQMKFSGKDIDGRHNLARGNATGDWIIKTPSTLFGHLPQNEFTAMSLAALAGVDIPEVKLVGVDTLDNLPPINLPMEKQAYAIKRFDRRGDGRVHMEDFAQVLARPPSMKYDRAIDSNKIARLLYRYSGDGLADAQQMSRRLLVNILLGNGDAHIKNWSLTYPDRVTPRLSPAYDIVATCVHSEDEAELALKLGKNRKWHAAGMDTFRAWADKADIPWKAVKPHVGDALDKARALWPGVLEDLPMDDGHKGMLRKHWGSLLPEFRI